MGKTLKMMGSLTRDVYNGACTVKMVNELLGLIKQVLSRFFVLFCFDLLLLFCFVFCLLIIRDGYPDVGLRLCPGG